MVPAAHQACVITFAKLKQASASPSTDTLRRQIAAWENQRNAAQARVNWHLTTNQARVRMYSLYPSVIG